MNQLDSDALALEYQRDYGTARGEMDISDFVNNPFINCVSSIFSLSFPEKLSNLPIVEIRVLRDNAPDSPLVTQDTI